MGLIIEYTVPPTLDFHFDYWSHSVTVVFHKIIHNRSNADMTVEPTEYTSSLCVQTELHISTYVK